MTPATITLWFDHRPSITLLDGPKLEIAMRKHLRIRPGSNPWNYVTAFERTPEGAF